MIRKIAQGILLICCGLIWTGCSAAPVQVNRAEAIVGASSLESKSLELSNCEGETELHRALAEEEQVVCTTTIADTATAARSDESLELSAELKAQLTEQIELTYQQVCAEAKNIVAQVEMVVPVGRVHKYEITWEQQSYSATIRFNVDRKTYTAGYTYRIDIPDAAISTRKACST